MTDEQVAALMQNWRDALAKQMDEMRVRQWALEKALETYKADVAASTGGSSHVTEIAEDILKFITEPFAETFKNENEP